MLPRKVYISSLTILFMIIGILLGISIAVFITSLIFLITGFSSIVNDNLITGATIGADGVVSYALIFLVLSIIAIFFLVLLIRPKQNY